MDSGYISPLTQRYASREMSELFSPHLRYTTWRKLWLSLARAQAELGLPIPHAEIKKLEQNIHRFDEKELEKLEKKVGHDVVAHLIHFHELGRGEKPILHLGATSTFVTDNADLILMRSALKLLIQKLERVEHEVAKFAKKYAGLVTLSYTHFQPAQPTTVGKRACLWLQDLRMDLAELKMRADLPFLGVKGATGTQASFLMLFDGDKQKVASLEKKVATDFGFKRILPIAGQTYTRKLDVQIVQSLAAFAASCHKCATDIRLLCHLKEMEEPFGKAQVGSSAMPHKRNPILAERLCALSRYLIACQENPLYTHALQWLERSLDDSANRRLVIPEAFLCADALLNLLIKLFEGLRVYPKMIQEHLDKELPFVMLENLLTQETKAGKHRMKAHTKFKNMSTKALEQIKQGKKSTLLHRLAKDFKKENLKGLAEEQAKKFIDE